MTKSKEVAARAYLSPTLVLLAMDWPAGAQAEDFLGFAILRSPGFAANEKDGYLFNKIGFSAPTADAQPMPSNLAPIQKFLWWDAGIDDKDRGKTFRYTITPVRGSGPKDLVLQHDAEKVIAVTLPLVEQDGISTWFNRAVVSSQAFSREFPDPSKDIPKAMDWLANGLEEAFAGILSGAKTIEGAVYHFTDKRWIVPALKGFKGKLSLVYQDQKRDTTDRPAIALLKSARFEGWPRSKTAIMHDKFLVDVEGGRVLTGSANFTPEGLTTQANLLHIFESAQLAKLYNARQKLMSTDPTVAVTAKDANWSKPIKIGKSTVRVFFSPEPAKNRLSIDRVIKTIKGAKSSVIFCMFDPTDPALLTALLATSDRKKLLFGLLNSISDPGNRKEDQSHSGEPPTTPSAATEIKVTLYNRSRKDKQVLAYSYFRKGQAPVGFLPELSTLDLTSQSAPEPKTGGKTKGGPPAVHIHHKFIVVDADTDSPTIYTGSANLSNNSTHRNDENLLEITGNTALAGVYLAEFMRLYEHYRARALWNMPHGSPRGAKGKPSAAAGKRVATTFTLKRTRDEWVRGAYKAGTLDYLARKNLAHEDD